MRKVCCQLSPFSHAQVRRDPYTNQVQICLKNGNQVATQITSESGFSLKDKKEQILAEVRSEIQKHEFQAESDKRSIQEFTGIIGSQRMKMIMLQQGVSNPGEINYYFKKNYPKKNRDLRETRIESLHEMEELKRVQELRVDEFSRRRLIENQDSLNEIHG